MKPNQSQPELTAGILKRVDPSQYSIIRTCVEDRTLQKELPGYLGYVQNVRYRLVPGIW